MDTVFSNRSCNVNFVGMLINGWENGGLVWWVRGWMGERMDVCVCVCMHACACVCACMCTVRSSQLYSLPCPNLKVLLQALDP